MHTRYFPSALVAALVVAACSIVTAKNASAADGTMTWGNAIPANPYTAPYEDLRLAKR